MTTKYRPGIKNIVGHVFGALFTGGMLFQMVFIRPLKVGDPTGEPVQGATHTWWTILLTYAVCAFLLLYCVYETIMMIRTRRHLACDPATKQDRIIEYRANTLNIIHRIVGALFCGTIFVLYFVFIRPTTVGNAPNKLIDGATSFFLPNILFYATLAFLFFYLVYEIFEMLCVHRQRKSEVDKSRNR